MGIVFGILRKGCFSSFWRGCGWLSCGGRRGPKPSHLRRPRRTLRHLPGVHSYPLIRSRTISPPALLRFTSQDKELLLTEQWKLSVGESVFSTRSVFWFKIRINKTPDQPGLLLPLPAPSLLPPCCLPPSLSPPPLPPCSLLPTVPCSPPVPSLLPPCSLLPPPYSVPTPSLLPPFSPCSCGQICLRRPGSSPSGLSLRGRQCEGSADSGASGGHGNQGLTGPGMLQGHQAQRHPAPSQHFSFKCRM